MRLYPILCQEPLLDSNFDTKLESGFLFQLAKQAPETPYKPAFLQFGRELYPLLHKVGALGSHNLFAYCENNSVINADHDGKMAIPAIYYGLCALLTVAGLGIASKLPPISLPKISLPKVSFTSSASTGISSVSVTTSSITNPRVLAREITAADVANLSIESDYMTGEAFYIAYAIRNTDNSPIFFINYALTLQQAKNILGTEGLLNEIIETASVGKASSLHFQYKKTKTSTSFNMSDMEASYRLSSVMRA